MKIQDIRQILKNNKKVVFSPDPDGLYYIIVDVSSLKVLFTTDTPDYKLENLEDILEEIYSKFYATHFQIEIHIHEGKRKDKDITILLNKNKELAKLSKVIKGIEKSKSTDLDRICELIHFIMNKFYQVDKWRYKAIK